MENLFSIIRGKNGNLFNPNPQQFRYALLASMVDSLLAHSDSSNFVDDMDVFLLNLQSVSEAPAQSDRDESDVRMYIDLQLQMDQDTEDLCEISNLVASSRDSQLLSVQDNVLFYIAGYTARKLKLIVCSESTSKVIGV